jgi:hypothetical protein
VVGAQALLDQVIRTAPVLAPLIETCFAPDVRERFTTMAEARAR